MDQTFFNNKYRYRDELREFSKHLNFILKQDELLDLTVKKIAKAMDVTRVVVMLQDEISGNYILGTQAGLDEIKAKELVLAKNKGVAAWLAKKNGEALIKKGVKNTVSADQLKEINQDLKLLGASVCIPLMVKGALLGLLAFSKRRSKKAFLYLDIKVLDLLTNQLAITLSYKKIEDKIIRNENLMQLGILTASLAHQIKNPLSSIRTFAQLLPDKYDDREFRDEFSKVVNQDIRRLVRIIDSIMDLSRAKEAEFRLMDIHEVIDESLVLVDTRLKAYGIELKKEYGSLPKFKGDSVLLKQAFLNLFLNDMQAMVEARKGDTIKVSTEFKKDLAVIKVEDNGPGIEENLLPRLFEPFITTKTTGKYRGLGLGLFITRRIIDQHNGIIKAESNLGKGAQFWIELPV